MLLRNVRLCWLQLLAGNDEAVEQLTGLSASQQLSTADLQPLILQAISKASHWSSSLDPARLVMVQGKP